VVGGSASSYRSLRLGGAFVLVISKMLTIPGDLVFAAARWLFGLIDSERR
jgi:hypothetical protein